ncbi:glycosyltransferase family 2 protein [Sphingomonas sp.]|uniref:glycosyltransferase family 2 protein n=1 Tax=Sphingomonas sp. TaxID=28214 RepID=UPI002DBA08D7|nr:glycosyltransferase family 2 protein [Sphingomonas sp.]HEU4968138.1 glycosyltransferase family 2 protein [Sphingomonas sp.]
MTAKRLGVVIVAFNSADVILDCLDSLFASDAADRLDVAVVDNASSDDTRTAIVEWAAGKRSAPHLDGVPGQAAPAPKPIAMETVRPGETGSAPLTLILSDVNGGYAYGVNAGLDYLRTRDGLAGYWVLNPDSIVPPAAPGRFLAALGSADQGMFSSRCLYVEAPETIQTDGGRFSRWTGVCTSVNAGRPAATTPLPDGATLDFVTGANIVVPRGFLDRVGPMHEDYFLYYEEVDWAWRRGGQPIAMVAGAEIYHRGGTSIGSSNGIRQASPFADYFNQRNRIWFVRRNFPMRTPIAVGWALAKAAQALLRTGTSQARAILAGALDLPPPQAVADRIADPAARRLAFGRHAGKGANR